MTFVERKYSIWYRENNLCKKLNPIDKVRRRPHIPQEGSYIVDNPSGVVIYQNIIK